MLDTEDKQKNKKKMNKWETTKIKKVSIKEPVLIEGLPGIGNVGKIIADYLIEQLKAEKIMSFFSYDLPNSVFVNEDNLVELPKIELYHKKIKDKDYLFLAGDVQPSNELGSYTFTELILNLMKKYKCKEIIALGGIGLTEIPEKPNVYVTGSDKRFVNRLVKKGAKPEVYGLVGPIIGISGLLVGLSKRKEIPSAALLTETYGHPMYLGIKSAKEALKVLVKMYKFKISYTSINKEIKLMEQEELGEEPDKKSAIHKLKKLKEINYIG